MSINDKEKAKSDLDFLEEDDEFEEFPAEGLLFITAFSDKTEFGKVFCFQISSLAKKTKMM